MAKLMKKKQKTVEIGQRFRATRQYGSEWVVEYSYVDGANIPHVRMYDAQNPSTKRTLAVSALLDSGQFEYIPASA